MSEEVLTLSVNNTLKDARSIMHKNHIRHLPIVNDEQQVIGIVSQRDVLAAEESHLMVEQQEQKESREAQVSIESFYNDRVITIAPGASALRAARYMQKHKLGCLPVTDNEKIVGIITESDFINVAINLMELSEQNEEFEL
jgi:CBS domain-containing protein